MNNIRGFMNKVGWPRVIIGCFLIALFIAGPFFGVKTDYSINNVLDRLGMSAVMVLSMVPMIQSGCGLNFGIPVGLIAGMIGAVMSLEFGFTGFLGVLSAMAVAIIFAIIFGYVYSLLLNKVKGDEMIIANYVGLSFVFLMNIMWLILPFKNPSSAQSFQGTGLRAIISLDKYWIHVLSDFGKIPVTSRFTIPTGMFIFFAIMCFLVWGFFKTKTGTAITAVGSNPEYARAAGINIDKMRTISVILSTVIAALGMIVYQQSFGFIQMFGAPLAFVFPSVAAVLLGGASVNKASISNVVIGTILFQGILTMTPAVINSAINIDVSEVIRIVVSNGMILYALTRREK